MKNMKKLLQKAMVFTLTAAMLVGTPMTASAAGLVDLYSISDGEGDYGDNSNRPEETGTITNTDTSTGFLIESNRANIVGIALDKEIIHAEKGEKETLKATVVLDKEVIPATADIYNAKKELVARAGTDIKDLIVQEMSKKIHWVVMYPEELGDDMPNPAEKVSISGNSVDRSEITLLPRQGTEEGKEVIVRASIDASYYYDADDKDSGYSEDNRKEVEIKQDSTRISADPYTKDAIVSVKEYTEGLTWSDAKGEDKTKADSEMHVKHTLDLSSKLVRDPKTANDAITWTSSNTKAATVNAAGVVTAKKAGETTDITAVSEHGAVATRTITVDPGTPATEIAIFVEKKDEEGNFAGYDSLKSYTQDLKDSRDVKSILIQTYAKKDVAVDETGTPLAGTKADADPSKAVGIKKGVQLLGGDWYVEKVGEEYKQVQMKVTDEVTLSSNKPLVATADLTHWNDWGAGGADINHIGVGTATITAKTTSGKKATVKVTVAATLTGLTIEGVNKNQSVYSGQSIQLTPGRTPSENKDAVKWSVTTDEEGKNKAKEASISAKGVLKIANKVTEGTLYVQLQASKAPKGQEPIKATPVPITIKQSSIDTITIKDGNATVAVGGFGSDDKKLNARTGAISGESKISVPLGRDFVAIVDGGKIAGLDEAELLTWKTSSPKIATISSDKGKSVKITAVGAGTANITVSGVHVAKNNNKASVFSVKFKVKVQQPVTSLTMNKPTVTLAQKTTSKGIQNQKVSLKVTFGPKKTDKSQTKIASWTVQKNGDTPTIVTDNKGTVTKTSISYNLEKATAGDVYTITAKSITGATATSTVTIVAPTTAVAIGDGLKTDGTPNTYTKNATEMKIGEGTINLKSYINVGSKNDPKWVTAGSDAAKEEKAENVTYSVNKKGIVTVDSNGKVYAVKKGTVTITAKTPTGKKATLKVTVK